MKHNSIRHNMISDFKSVNSAIRITAVILSYVLFFRFRYYWLLLAPMVFLTLSMMSNKYLSQ